MHPPIRATNHNPSRARGRRALAERLTEKNHTGDGKKKKKLREKKLQLAFPPRALALLRCRKYMLAKIQAYVS